MTRFNVTAWCDRTFFTRLEVEAETPEQALAIAQEQAGGGEAEECDDGYYWDTFLVCDAEDKPHLRHLDERAKRREAAPELLEALKLCRDRLSSWVANIESCDLSPEDEEALHKATVAVAEAEAAGIAPAPTASVISEETQATRGEGTMDDITNSTRAERARVALQGYIEARGEVFENSSSEIADLMADLLHLAAGLSEGENTAEGTVERCLRLARIHFEAEHGDPEEGGVAEGRNPGGDPHEALLLASAYIGYVKERDPTLHGEANGTPSIEQAVTKAIAAIEGKDEE